MQGESSCSCFACLPRYASICELPGPEHRRPLHLCLWPSLVLLQSKAASYADECMCCRALSRARSRQISHLLRCHDAAGIDWNQSWQDSWPAVPSCHALATCNIFPLPCLSPMSKSTKAWCNSELICATDVSRQVLRRRNMAKVTYLRAGLLGVR